MTRAITVQQPWAAAIAWGTKNIENRSRSFPSNYRGELLIHAGQRLSQRGFNDPRIIEEISGGVFAETAYNLAAIVAVCDLDDIHPDAGCCRPWGESGYRNHPSGEVKEVVHLVLDNVTPVNVPYRKGRLGLWIPPDDLIAAVFPGRRA